MKLDVFGRKTLEIVRRDNKWLAFYCGSEGKKRAADDLRIPASLSEEEVLGYVADIYHEYATAEFNTVKRI